MAITAITDKPGSANEIAANIIISHAGSLHRIVLPIMEGTVSNPDKNYERNPVIRSDRQGGDQIGGTVGASATVVVPVMNEEAIKKLLESLLFTSRTTSTTATGHAALTERYLPGTTRVPFTLETIYKYYNSTGGAQYSYEYTYDAECASAAVNVPTTGAATLTFSVLGQSYAVTSSQIASVGTVEIGSTVPLAGRTPMSGTITGALLAQYATNAMAWTDNGTRIGAEQGSINIDNNMELKYAIGSGSADHVGIGDFDVTASITAYFRGSQFQTLYTAETRKGYRFIFKAANEDGRWVMDIGRAVPTAAPKGTSSVTLTEQVNMFAEYSSHIGGKIRLYLATADVP